MRLPASISKWRLATVIAVLSVLAGGSPRAATELELMDDAVSSLYQKSKDAIVKVYAETSLPVAGRIPFRMPPRAATGFFIDGDGHLLTVATVVQGADSCWIDWQGQRVPAKVLGCDPDTKLALLKVDPGQCVGAGQALPFLTQGNSDDLRIGSMVIAIGFPYDMPSMPTMGFVGGLDIKCGAHTFMTSHFRVNCRLSPGQGGSPLLNPRGEVVGMAVAAHGDDQCYALPINAARNVSDELLHAGTTQHGWVGLSVAERRFLPGPAGVNLWQVYVQQIYSNTPAAEAGFHDQDVLLRICTNEIHRAADVLNTMFYHHCGERIKITVLRDGQRQEVSLIISKRPQIEQVVMSPYPPFPFLQPGIVLPAVEPAPAPK